MRFVVMSTTELRKAGYTINREPLNNREWNALCSVSDKGKMLNILCWGLDKGSLEKRATEDNNRYKSLKLKVINMAESVNNPENDG